MRMVKLLSIYLEKMKNLIRKDACTLIFIAALFTVAKAWKQPKRESIAEQMKNMRYIYTVEYYSVIKKN